MINTILEVNNPKNCTIILLGILIIIVSFTSKSMASYELKKQSINNGSIVDASSGTYTTSTSIGQTATGISTNGSDSLLSGLFYRINTNTETIELAISDDSVQVGDSVNISVIVTGFSNVLGVQLKIQYDPAVLAIIEDTASSIFLSGMTLGGGANDVTVIWDGNTTPVTIPDGDTLLILHFSAIGNSGEVSSLNWDLGFTALFDEIGNTLPFSTQNGSVTLTGPSVELWLPQMMVLEGSQIQVPVTVQQFTDVLGCQLKVHFDSLILNIAGDTAVSDYLIGMTLGLTANSVTIIWDGNTTPVSVPDGDTLLKFVFDVIGGAGDTSDLSWDQGFTALFDETGNVMPLSTHNGLVAVDVDTICSALYVSPSPSGNDTTGDGSLSNPFATIQHAIDLAKYCDTVMLLPGTYTGDGNRDIDFLGKSIVVMSGFGSDSTIVDCEGSEGDQHRGFYFHNGEDSSSVLQGITIVNGYDTLQGGAVLCYFSSPTFEDCVFRNNKARAYGGNESSNVYGGGVCCISSSPTINECVFESNSTWGYSRGGGLYCDTSSSPTVIGCDFLENTSYINSGGGVYCLSPSITFKDCYFNNNSAGYEGRGGGIYMSNGGALFVTNCIFENNQGDGGAAIFCSGNESVIIDGSLFFDNEVPESGGIVSLWNNSNVIRNSTFTSNVSYQSGFKYVINVAGPLWVENTIVAHNIGTGLYYTGDTTQEIVSITCSDFFDNHGCYTCSNYSGIPDQTGINANISSDPRFCDIANSDFSVAANSPCQPDNNVCHQLIGAISDTCGPIYQIWYVDTTGNDTTGSGTETNPFKTIQKGVNAAASGDTVIIKNGIYTGVGNRDIIVRYKSLLIKGESGYENVIINVQDTTKNGFISSCTGCPANDTITIAGITIRGANWGVYSNTAGTMILDTCQLDSNLIGAGTEWDNNIQLMKFHLCKVSDNINYGIYSYLPYGKTEKCLIDSCVFEGNGTAIFGTFNASYCTIQNGNFGVGGSRMLAGNDFILSNCVFENLSRRVIYSAARSQLLNCTIRRNSDTIIFVTLDRNLYLDSCLISDNTGPGVFIYDISEYWSKLDMKNTLYNNNKGGISAFSSHQHNYVILLDGCTFTANTGNAIETQGLAGVSIFNCIIAYNDSIGIKLDTVGTTDSILCNDVYFNGLGNYYGLPDQTGFNGNISLDPMFCDTADTNYHIYDISPCAPGNNSCSTLFGALPVMCYATDIIYVSVSGSDTSGDGTFGNPYKTITKGISEVPECGTVMVLPGTYEEHVLIQKCMKLISSAGKDFTNIQASPNNRVVTIDSVADSVVIDGFEITGGNPNGALRGDFGGGILAFSSHAIIKNCDIHDNVAPASGNGGGISSRQGSFVELYNNDIHHNTATTVGGGIMINDPTGGLLRNNIITYNHSDANGGGIFLYAQTSSGIWYDISNNTISYNENGNQGSGVEIRRINTRIENNIITFNNPVDTNLNSSCAGIWVSQCSLCVKCNDVYENCGGNNYHDGGGIELCPDMSSFPPGLNDISEDPDFCKTPDSFFYLDCNSPCLPENNVCSLLIGALGEGCCNICILDSIVIEGPISVQVNSSTNYNCRAYYTNCPDSLIEPLWELLDTTYASISSSGVLTVNTPPSGTQIIITASYTDGSIIAVDSLFVTVSTFEDSLIVLSTLGKPCHSVCTIDAVQSVIVKLSQPVKSVNIPIKIPLEAGVCNVTFDNYVTEDWEMREVIIDSDVVVVGLANFHGELLPGDSTLPETPIFNINYTADQYCYDHYIRWDTALSTDPHLSLLFVDTSNNTFVPKFNHLRDSLTIMYDFLEGDCNNDGDTNVADLMDLISWLYEGGAAPCIINTMDINADCAINIADVSYYISFLWEGGPELKCGCYFPGQTQVAKINTEIFAVADNTDQETVISLQTKYNLRGIEFTLVSDGSNSVPVNLIDDDLELFYHINGNVIKIGIIDLQGKKLIHAGNRKILKLNGKWKIISAIVSDMNHTGWSVRTDKKEHKPSLPKDFVLYQNYPNPFNPITVIEYDIETPVHVRLEVYNLLGQIVRTLVDINQGVGNYSTYWDGKDSEGQSVSSGIYLYRIQAGEFTDTKKMLFIK